MIENGMIEIRLHGRGGQGAVVASSILATAAFLEGKYVQSFPAFGVERRGAPVTAYVRLSHSPIFLRCAIYQPHHMIVLEKNLMARGGDITRGLRSGGSVLVNTLPELFTPPPGESQGQYRYALVDASGIAVRNKLGTKTSPIVNTAIVGAFAKSSGLLSLEAVSRAIEKLVPVHVEQNIAAAHEAFHQTVIYERESPLKVEEKIS